MKSVLKHIVVAILTLEARLVLKKYRPKVVAVTGNVGKTSTKDAVYTVLKSHEHVRKSEKSFNSEIGVPLTILGLGNAWSSPFKWLENILHGVLLVLLPSKYPSWIVLEVGADHPGDIKRIGQWIHPDIVIMTRLPEVPVHIEFFGSKEAVIEEKRHLRRALKEGGTLVVNGDDPLLVEEPVREGQRRLCYGFGEHCDVRGSNVRYAYVQGVPVGITCDVMFQGARGELSLRGTLGAHHLMAMLAAVTVGIAEGYRFEDIVEALRSHSTPPGRMRILEGVGGSTLIDDSYNASPLALEEALRVVRELDVPGRRIAALGDMMELGEFSVDAHKKAGTQVAETADLFIAAGVRMQGALEGAQAAGMPAEKLRMSNGAEDAARMLEAELREGDLVLIKGSQSTRMEKTVAALLRHPERDRKFLVRQEEEWRRR